MEKIVASEWDAAFGGFTGWMAQIESDRINFELQLLQDKNFDAQVDEQHALVRQTTEPHLRAGEVDEDTDRPTHVCGHGPDAVVALERQFERLVRQVDAGNVHPSLHQTLQHARII